MKIFFCDEHRNYTLKDYLKHNRHTLGDEPDLYYGLCVGNDQEMAQSQNTPSQKARPIKPTDKESPGRAYASEDHRVQEGTSTDEEEFSEFEELEEDVVNQTFREAQQRREEERMAWEKQQREKDERKRKRERKKVGDAGTAPEAADDDVEQGEETIEARRDCGVSRRVNTVNDNLSAVDDATASSDITKEKGVASGPSPSGLIPTTTIEAAAPVISSFVISSTSQSVQLESVVEVKQRPKATSKQIQQRHRGSAHPLVSKVGRSRSVGAKAKQGIIPVAIETQKRSANLETKERVSEIPTSGLGGTAGIKKQQPGSTESPAFTTPKTSKTNIKGTKFLPPSALGVVVVASNVSVTTASKSSTSTAASATTKVSTSVTANEKISSNKCENAGVSGFAKVGGNNMSREYHSDSMNLESQEHGIGTRKNSKRQRKCTDNANHGSRPSPRNTKPRIENLATSASQDKVQSNRTNEGSGGREEPWDIQEHDMPGNEHKGNDIHELRWREGGVYKRDRYERIHEREERSPRDHPVGWTGHASDADDWGTRGSPGGYTNSSRLSGPRLQGSNAFREEWKTNGTHAGHNSWQTHSYHAIGRQERRREPETTEKNKKAWAGNLHGSKSARFDRGNHTSGSQWETIEIISPIGPREGGYVEGTGSNREFCRGSRGTIVKRENVAPILCKYFMGAGNFAHILSSV